MTVIDLNDYVAAGYFITKYATDGYWKSPLMPERIISLSHCHGKTVKAYWWNIEEFRQEVLDFGVPPEKLSAFKEWSSSDRIEFPDVFRSQKEAQHFIAEFLPAQDDVVLIGAALPSEMVDDFLIDNKQQILDVNRQNLLDDLHGVNRVLSDKESLNMDGQILGFEVVSYGYGLSHSWLCSGIEKDMNDLFGIRPNQYGLIDTFEEAKKVYDWIDEDDARGEPEPYYPWLIVRYPLTVTL